MRSGSKPAASSPSPREAPSGGWAKNGFAHPLLGANLGTLSKTLRRYGPVAPSKRPVAAAAFASALLRWPFSAAEKAWVALSRGRVQKPPDPIFILGHWRSGTTHLYNLLSRDERFGYVPPFATGLPWDFLLLGRLARPLLVRALPKSRAIDNVPVTASSPQEDEIALASMTPQSFFHGLYFPRRFEAVARQHIFFDGYSEADVEAWSRTFRYFLEKVARLAPGRRLIVKNPVYTARMGLLRQMFPDARFIHIHRNPDEVFLSTRNFYRKLLPRLALQGVPRRSLDDFILETYDRMMRRLADDAGEATPDRFAEVAFAALERDPLGELERVYRRLDLGDFAAARPAMASYVDSIRGYKKNVFQASEEDRALTRARARFAFENWGY